MFEHKSHALIPFPQFIIRVLRFFLYSLLLICIALLIGTLGYHTFAELGWIDSFYNASMILTGMGPAAVMATSKAKIFSSFYALFSGIAFLSTFAILFTPIAHRILHAFHIENNDSK